MKVRFLQSGGFMGAARGCELDTARLEKSDAQELENLVRESGLPASGEFLSETARDLYEYEIQVEAPGKKTNVLFDDQSLPVSARPLVSFLKKHSRPQPLK